MTRFEKWSVLLTTLGTVVTGFGYFWTKYLFRSSDPWAVINHPLQPWFLKAHVLVAPLMLFAVGTIAVRHIWRHFRGRMRWGRRSGVSAMLTLLPMVATGYLIQVITGEGMLRAMAISHIALGSLFAVGFGLHYLAVRRPPPRERMLRQTRRLHIPAERAHFTRRQPQS